MLKSGPLRTTDDGVFAILYALLVLVLVGTAAVVVDLAMLRESRASTRSAADSAVLVAAASLIPVRPSLNDPSTGCRRAWRYLMNSLGGSGPNQLHDGSGSCTVFPLPPVDTPCPTTPITATNTSFGWTVAVTWPVRDNSDLMLKPDLAPASVKQSVDTGFDGTNPCARVGLEIFKTNSPFFAGVFGSGAVQTRAASVARATDDVIAALNILEPTRCAALTTVGQGSILVNGTGGDAGLIAVESDGLTTSGDSDCDDTNAVIALSGGSIKASGPGATGQGLIQAFALNRPPIGNPMKAYTGELSPVPTLLPERYGVAPVTDVFNCASAVCAPGEGPWIDELESALGGVGTPTIAYSGAQPPYSTAAFVQLADSVVPGFSCSNNPGPIVIVPVGNWYIDCPGGLDVTKTLIFQGGVIVTSGPIDVVGDGCLAVNVPATVCPSANTLATPVTTNPVPTGDAILYIRPGHLFKNRDATLLLPQTFTYLGDGVTDMEQGPAGSLLWTSPIARNCLAGDPRCLNRQFKRLALWSEANQLHRIRGQSNLALRGVLFTPNASLSFDGGAGEQENEMAAQFWTRTLEVSGERPLVLTVDRDVAVARPQPGVALIR